MAISRGPIYCVMLFETVAIVGRVFGENHGDIPSGTRRVADMVAAFPRWEGEKIKSWTHGTRDELLAQAGVGEWLSPEVLDRCDEDRMNQQEVELPE